MLVQLPDEQRERIETLAHERGYENAADYILALIEADDFTDDPEEAAVDLEARFRAGWQAAMRGEARPVEELLAELEREETDEQ